MRCLLVEDHLSTADVLGQYLVDAGLEMARVLRAEDAVEWINKTPVPAVVIADHFLPEGTGMDLLRELRKREDTREVPFVLITAASDEDYEEIREEFYEKLKGSRIVRKPFNPPVLLTVLNEVLGPKLARPLTAPPQSVVLRP